MRGFPVKWIPSKIHRMELRMTLFLSIFLLTLPDKFAERIQLNSLEIYKTILLLGRKRKMILQFSSRKNAIFPLCVQFCLKFFDIFGGFSKEKFEKFEKKI